MEEARWTVGTWQKEAYEFLKNHDNPDAEWDADWMLCEALNCGRSELRWRRNEIIPSEKASQLNGWLRSRTAGRPLQYVLGNTCFMGLTLHCDERALIPRQDTETLVELALHRMQHRKSPQVLDLCSGTGAIGLSIKHYRPDASVVLADISSEALALARENAALTQCDMRFAQGDLFAAVSEETYDFILSNPPYLTEQDMNDLMREVRHEPALALRAGTDGLVFYRRIADELRSMLKEGGEALLEIGKGQEDDVIALLRAKGFRAEAYKDLCGVNRVIRAWGQDN